MPILVESHKTTTLRALVIIADLMAASCESAVDKPWSTVSALVPMNATSARMSARVRSAAFPTTAWVMPRTDPPRSCISSNPELAKVRAMDRLLVTIDHCFAAGCIVMSSAKAAVVVPASRNMPPPGASGRNCRAACAMELFAPDAERRRASTLYSVVWNV